MGRDSQEDQTILKIFRRRGQLHSQLLVAIVHTPRDLTDLTGLQQIKALTGQADGEPLVEGMNACIGEGGQAGSLEKRRSHPGHERFDDFERLLAGIPKPRTGPSFAAFPHGANRFRVNKPAAGGL